MSNLFIGLGFQKCATTWLSRRLRRHPEIWAPPINELHFWDTYEQARERLPYQYRYVKNAKNKIEAGADGKAKINAKNVIEYWRHYRQISPDSFASYLQLFQAQPLHKAFGEITPSYVGLHEDTLKIMANGMKDVRFFVLMREPIARIWSQIRHEHRLRPAEVSSSELMIRYLESDRMVAQANYTRVLSTMKKILPPERFGIFFFEDMIADEENYLRSICEFLGVKYSKRMLVRQDDGGSRSKEAKAVMPSEVKMRAIELYGHVAHDVSQMIGRVPESWNKVQVS